MTGTNNDLGSLAAESEDELMNDNVKIRKSQVKPLKLMDEVVGSRDVLYTWQCQTAEARYGTHIVTGGIWFSPDYV